MIIGALFWSLVIGLIIVADRAHRVRRFRTGQVVLTARRHWEPGTRVELDVASVD